MSSPPFLRDIKRQNWEGKKAKEKCRIQCLPSKKAYNPPTMPKVKSFSQVQRSSKTSQIQISPYVTKILQKSYYFPICFSCLRYRTHRCLASLISLPEIFTPDNQGPPITFLSESPRNVFIPSVFGSLLKSESNHKRPFSYCTISVNLLISSQVIN